jgi:hypothetical protein
MGCLTKGLVSVLILAMAVSCLTLTLIRPANAQTAASSPAPIPIPSIPEFTVQLIGPPYIVNTTYNFDEDTGKIVPLIGFTNQYSYLEIRIKNQLFTPFFGDDHGNTVQIQYNVRIKQSNETNNWIEVYSPYNGYPIQANSDAYTTFNISIEGGWDSSLGSIVGTQSDIQVEALAGYVHRMVIWSPNFGGAPYVFNGTESGWSKTQTISVPENVPMTTSTSTPSAPTELSWLVTIALLLSVLALFLSVLCLAVLLRHRETVNLLNSCSDEIKRIKV